MSCCQKITELNSPGSFYVKYTPILDFLFSLPSRQSLGLIFALIFSEICDFDLYQTVSVRVCYHHTSIWYYQLLCCIITSREKMRAADSSLYILNKRLQWQIIKYFSGRICYNIRHIKVADS